MRSIPTGARLFAAALLVYIVCPPFLSYDSYYTVPTALSILRGTTTVDSYVASAPRDAEYAVECVPATGAAVRYWDARGCPDGHWFDYFPVGVPVLAAPLVAAAQVATRAVAALHPGPVSSQPNIAAFFAGDLMGGRPLTELACASVIGALSVWLQFAIARRFLPAGRAVALALLFAFGTSQWSIASRNLEQHGLTVLLLSAAIYAAVRAIDEPRWIARAGLPLALAFVVRPSNAIAVAAFTVLVAARYRRDLWRYVAWAAPVAAVFFAYNLAVRHSLLPLYFEFTGHGTYPMAAGLAMHLVSPSRGIFVFTPVFLFALAGLAAAARDKRIAALAICLGAILVGHTVLVSRYWDGHTYGPRYLSDMTPMFCFLLIPVLRSLRGFARGAFVALALWGVFVHARGATSIAANQWSILPVNVDQATWRVWDWSDPQFLRGLK